MVEVIIPPTMGAAIGFITSDPMPVSRRIGIRLARTHLLSTTPRHSYFGKVFPNMGAPLFDCSSVASS